LGLLKLTGAKANAFFTKPDASVSGILIFGADATKISVKRKDLLLALVGENADEEMRLTRLLGAEVRKDPAAVQDGIKAQGFFPGPRVVFVEEAGDGLADVMAAALAEREAGDATLVVTAGQLNARSKLRKVFEGDRSAIAIGLYDDPPTREEVEKNLRDAGLRDIPKAAMDDIMILSRTLDVGDFRQTIEKIALYKGNETTPLSAEDIMAVAPMTADVNIDDAINLVAEARSSEIAPMIKKLTSQGVNPTTLCISATRHFRTLHAVAGDPQGVDAALSRARPPVFGPRRDRMSRQVKSWGVHRLEKALSVLMDTDLALRSSRPVPTLALIERAFIRIAMMRR
jgi:DNA polymerase-3 subunit delta